MKKLLFLFAFIALYSLSKAADTGAICNGGVLIHPKWILTWYDSRKYESSPEVKIRNQIFKVVKTVKIPLKNSSHFGIQLLNLDKNVTGITPLQCPSVKSLNLIHQHLFVYMSPKSDKDSMLDFDLEKKMRSMHLWPDKNYNVHRYPAGAIYTQDQAEGNLMLSGILCSSGGYYIDLTDQIICKQIDKTINPESLSSLKNLPLEVSQQILKEVFESKKAIYSHMLTSKRVCELSISCDKTHQLRFSCKQLLNIPASQVQKFRNISLTLTSYECHCHSKILDYLSRFTKLKHLELKIRESSVGKDRMPCLSILNNLKELESLKLVNCTLTNENAEQLKDVINLKDLTLSYVDISSLSWILHLKDRLKYLKIEHCPLIPSSEFSSIGAFSRLETLNLNNTNVDSLSWMHSLSDTLQHLYLHNCRCIRSNEFYNIARLIRLRLLNLDNTRILSLIQSLPLTDTLEDLSLKECRTILKNEFDFLNNFSKLKTLNLDYTKIDDLNCLMSLSHCLEQLSLRGCSLSQYSILKEFKNLNYLNLSMTNVSDLRFLINLGSNLTFLALEDCHYIAPNTLDSLRYLPNLKVFYLESAELFPSDIAAVMHLKENLWKDAKIVSITSKSPPTAFNLFLEKIIKGLDNLSASFESDSTYGSSSQDLK